MKTVLNMIQQEKMHSTSSNIFIPLMFRIFSFKDLLYSLRSNVLIFAQKNAKKNKVESPQVFARIPSLFGDLKLK